MTRMFSFITKTWNPVKGCKHKCIYCWASKLAETRLSKTKKYKDGFKPKIFPEELKVKFYDGEFVFVCDMGDLFGRWVPAEWIQEVIKVVEENPQTQFLFLTKNPKRYLEFSFPGNAWLGATIETNRNTKKLGISRAPKPWDRIRAMSLLKHPKKFVAIEPILDFDLNRFITWLLLIQPIKVCIGYDNYNNRLPEPPLRKTLQLIRLLRKFSEVETKTLRRPIK